MGIWNLAGNGDCDCGEAVALVDSVTMTPIPIRLFASQEDADSFVAWVAGDPSGGALLRMPLALLAELRDEWDETRPEIETADTLRPGELEVA